MGVMPCHRSNCENIMCDTYVSDVGYICSDCQKEFEFFVSAKNKVRTEDRLLKWLKEFMDTTSKKECYSTGEGITTQQFFEKSRCSS